MQFEVILRSLPLADTGFAYDPNEDPDGVNYILIGFILLMLVLFGLIVHVGIQRNFPMVLVAQQLFSFSRQYFSTVLPVMLDQSVLNRLGIMRADPQIRTLIFAPLFSIGAPLMVLLVPGLLSAVVTFVRFVKTRI